MRPSSVRAIRAGVVAFAVAAALAEIAIGLTQATAFTTTDRYSPYLLAFSFARLVIAGVAGLLLTKAVLSRDEGLLFAGLVGVSLDVSWPFFPAGAPMWFGAILANGAFAYGILQLVRYAFVRVRDARTARAAAVLGCVVAVVMAGAGFTPIFVGYSPWFAWLDQDRFDALGALFDRIRWGALLVGCVAIEGGAIVAYRRADVAQRTKTLVAALGFAPLVIGTLVHGIFIERDGRDVVDWAKNVDAVGTVLSAAILMYGASTRRLLDIAFYVPSAVGATITTAWLAVAAFLVEHYLVPPVESFVLELEPVHRFDEAVRQGIEIAFAFGVFLTIETVHERAVEFARDLIFHHREERLHAIRAFAEDLASDDAERVAEALAERAVEDAEAIAAGVYLCGASAFTRVAAHGTASGAIGSDDIAPNDPRVPTAGVLLGDDGSATFPMRVGTSLVGFLRCERKRSDTTYAPDELRALALAAREAGIVLAARAELSPRPQSTDATTHRRAFGALNRGAAATTLPWSSVIDRSR